MSTAAGRGAGGRAGGREGRENQAGGRGRGSNQNRTTPAFKNPIEGLKPLGYGDATHPSIFEEVWEALANRRRQTGADGAPEVAAAMEQFTAPTVDVPDPPPDNIPDPNNAGQQIPNPHLRRDTLLWEGRIKMIPQLEQKLQVQLKAAYVDVWESCHPKLKTKLKSLPNYEQIDADKDVISLGLQIRALACGAESTKNKVYTMVQLNKMIITFYQKNGQSNSDYLKQFQGIYNAIEQQGGTLCTMPRVVEARARQLAAEDGRNDVSDDDMDAAEAAVNEEIKTAYFLSGANQTMHGDLKLDLANSFVKGENKYPTTIAACMELLESWESPMRRGQNAQRQQQRGGEAEGVSFAQHGSFDEPKEECEDGAAADKPGGGATPDRIPSRRNRRRKKNKVKFEQDAAGNPVIPHQSHAMDGEEEETGQEGGDENVECPHCNGDHTLAACPDLTIEQLREIHLQLCEEEGVDADGVSFLQEGAALITDQRQIRTGGLRQNRLYLDTCTTSELMANAAFLTKIFQSDTALNLHTNAGTSRTKMKGFLGSIEFWLDPYAIASVVSLRTLEQKFPRVRYDSTQRGGAFIVETPSGEVVFERCEVTGFPYIDLTEEGNSMAVQLVQATSTRSMNAASARNRNNANDDMDEATANNHLDHHVATPTTLRRRYEGFTRREVEEAIKARLAQAAAGFPSDATMKSEVSRKSPSSLYQKCPTTTKDITNAKKIFGPSVPCLKGKQVRRKPDRVNPSYVSIPADLIKQHKFVILAADVMFVCGMPFLISLSRGIKFVTVQYVPRRTAPELANAFKNIVALYSRAGYVCQLGLMDNEFEKVKELVADLIEINTTAANEHVPEIERKIRHVKERCRTCKASLPFEFMPNLMIRSLVTHMVMMINAHIDKSGISDVYSPRELVLRWQLDWTKHCRAPFGVYCIAYDDPTITNTQEERATEAICLGPTGNFNGTYKFLSLKTGKVIKRRKFDVIPTPDSVNKKINSWGRRLATKERRRR